MTPPPASDAEGPRASSARGRSTLAEYPRASSISASQQIGVVVVRGASSAPGRNALEAGSRLSIDGLGQGMQRPVRLLPARMHEDEVPEIHPGVACRASSVGQRGRSDGRAARSALDASSRPAVQHGSR